jgi:hypothetical protein
MSALPEHGRLILADEDILTSFGARTDYGDKITAEWGDPMPEGWYTPTFTVHYDDNLVAAERDRIREAVEGLPGVMDPLNRSAEYRPHIDRAAVLRLLEAPDDPA